MHFVFIDECNHNRDKEKESRDFLIIGAVLINSDEAREISDRIESIRGKYGFHRTSSLKFSHNFCKEMDRDAHREAKDEVFAVARDHGVQFIGYCTHHKIAAHNYEDDVYVYWGLDQILTKTQQYLNEKADGDDFIAFVDRTDKSDYSVYCRRRFEERNNQAKEGFNTPSLISIGFSWDQTSHLASMADIVIGSFNYLVNHPQRDKAGKALAKNLKPLIWGRQEGKGKRVGGRGLLFRPDPETIWFAKHKALYVETRDRVIEWANKK